MKLFCDLHIHSCLSPCGDNDMTPANILGMGAVKGLQMMAVTDHNAAGNLPTAQKVADAYGILLIPGIEITTSEEVHMLGYFPSVPVAVEFGDFLRDHLPKKKNKPSLFGQQLVLDEDDQLIREEEAGMLRSAMQRLTEDHRQVLLLKYFEEMSAEEIGTVMNKSKHSVNGLLKRAKAALRQELKKEGYRHERS